MNTAKALLFISITVLLILFYACNNKNLANKDKHESITEKTEETMIVTAPLVKKAFVNKGGETGNFQEWYVRLSTDDYFIKFCESKVSRAELEKEIGKQSDEMINSLSMEIEIREGEWDICDETEMLQSRVGEYAVIYSIVK
ncbi:MAG TPA: hypothetical protein PLO05_09095 [Bacteroidales bacterium]|jgi:hypothetical protein|nr:hypothetical protein [Bacteroidales bacterium]